MGATGGGYHRPPPPDGETEARMEIRYPKPFVDPLALPHNSAHRNPVGPAATSTSRHRAASPPASRLRPSPSCRPVPVDTRSPLPSRLCFSSKPVAVQRTSSVETWQLLLGGDVTRRLVADKNGPSKTEETAPGKGFGAKGFASPARRSTAWGGTEGFIAIKLPRAGNPRPGEAKASIFSTGGQQDPAQDPVGAPVSPRSRQGAGMGREGPCDRLATGLAATFRVPSAAPALLALRVLLEGPRELPPALPRRRR
nr:PREDICTED: uncharacterized protein LOC106486139 [Apteryx mantelli mantelli]